MNGRLPPALIHAWPYSGPLGGLRAVVSPDLYLKRFYAALMVSCLLHAAIVLLPYLGARVTVSGPSLPGVQKPGSARILNVRLVEEKTAELSSAAQPPVQPATSEQPPPASDRSLGSGLLPIPAPTYYTTDQLSKRPQPMSEPNFDASGTGMDFGAGKVVLNLWISELGRVVSVQADKGGVPEAVAASAAAAFGKLRYVPGEINGRPVGVMMKIEVSFDSSQAPPPLPRKPISRSNRLGLNPNP